MGSSSNKDSNQNPIHIHVNLYQNPQNPQIPQNFLNHISESTEASQFNQNINNLGKSGNIDAAPPTQANENNNNPINLSLSINQNGQNIYSNHNKSYNENINGNINSINKNNNIINNNINDNTNSNNNIINNNIIDNTNSNNNRIQISPGQNIDNNIENTIMDSKLNKDPNIGHYVNKPKKETAKTFEPKEDLDINMGKGYQNKVEDTKGGSSKPNPDNNIGQFTGTFTGDNEYSLFNSNNKADKSKNNSNLTAGSNIDNNIDNKNTSNNDSSSQDFNYQQMINSFKNKNSINDKEEFEENDLEMSRSIIFHSFEGLSFGNAKDLAKIKEIVNKKYSEGYYSLYVKMGDMKPSFYFIKMEHNLDNLLNAHMNLIGKSPTGENYSFYIGDRKLDPKIKIQDLDIKMFSVINIK